jgi:hypothetical protein
MCVSVYACKRVYTLCYMLCILFLLRVHVGQLAKCMRTSLQQKVQLVLAGQKIAEEQTYYAVHSVVDSMLRFTRRRL